ncbi:cell division topological specificity factor MinE [Desulforegula conservatrix]|uniref:cell division topological specificity factor MinE n=1 Tax=Desulforegula conservatrix TaxID=153026 RepID=UPI001E2EF956|nr:cell division topological specificity factor MinE [Desulforegula conservatrix]
MADKEADVLGIVQRLFGKEPASKDVAKKRLKFALVYDKLEISDEMLQELQSDIIAVISKYFEIDKSSLKLDIQRSDDLSALVFNTPIIAAKRKNVAP